MELHSNLGKLLRQALCEHNHTGKTGYLKQEAPKLFENLPLGWRIEKLKDVEYAWTPVICYNCGYQDPPVI